MRSGLRSKLAGALIIASSLGSSIADKVTNTSGDGLMPASSVVSRVMSVDKIRNCTYHRSAGDRGWSCGLAKAYPRQLSGNDPRNYLGENLRAGLSHIFNPLTELLLGLGLIYKGIRKKENE